MDSTRVAAAAWVLASVTSFLNSDSTPMRQLMEAVYVAKQQSTTQDRAQMSGHAAYDSAGASMGLERSILTRL